MNRAVIAGVFVAVDVFATAGAMQVDGVKVHGKVHAVSVADIREAMTTGIGDSSKASEVEVISATEIHVYLQPRDLGWVPLRPQEIFEHVGRDHHLEKRVRWRPVGIAFFSPEVLAVIRAAEQVYVFPVASPLQPQRDDKHMRALDGEARAKIVRLLGDKGSWWDGMYHLAIIDDGSRGIGLIFRHGRDEVVIFWSRITVTEGTFNGRNVAGLLNDGPEQALERWANRYARHELAPK